MLCLVCDIFSILFSRSVDSLLILATQSFRCFFCSWQVWRWSVVYILCSLFNMCGYFHVERLYDVFWNWLIYLIHFANILYLAYVLFSYCLEKKHCIIFSKRVNWIDGERLTEHVCRSVDSLLIYATQSFCCIFVRDRPVKEVPVPSASIAVSFPHNTTKSQTGRDLHGLHKTVRVLNSHIDTHCKHTVKYPSHLEAAYYIWLCGINTWNSGRKSVKDAGCHMQRLFCGQSPPSQGINVQLSLEMVEEYKEKKRRESSVMTAMLSIFILIRKIWLPFISDYNNSRMVRTENSVASLNAEMSRVLFDHTDKPGHWTVGISTLASKQPVSKADTPSTPTEAFPENIQRRKWGVKEKPTATQMNSCRKPHCFFSIASSVSAFWTSIQSNLW